MARSKQDDKTPGVTVFRTVDLKKVYPGDGSEVWALRGVKEHHHFAEVKRLGVHLAFVPLTECPRANVAAALTATLIRDSPIEFLQPG